MFARPGLFLFGLTGGVASGKSTVGRLLRQRGVTVIDADDLARRVVLPGQPALAEIESAFPGVVTDGALDRAALGQLVFADPSARAKLNAIVHPRVAVALDQELDALASSLTASANAAASSAVPAPSTAPAASALVAYEVPLLFENNLDRWLRPTVLVACDEVSQVARAMGRNGWTREHTMERIAAQMPLADKRQRADIVIENIGDLEALAQRTDLVVSELAARIRQAEPASQGPTI